MDEKRGIERTVLVKECNLVGNFRKDFDAAHKNAAELIVIVLPIRAAFIEVRTGVFHKLFKRQLFHVKLIEPAHFRFVEYAAAFGKPRYVEFFDKFFHRHFSVLSLGLHPRRDI